MNQRGEYGLASRGICGDHVRARAVVGAAPFQAGDAERAVEQLDAEMEAIVNATYRSMNVDPTTLRRPAAPDEAWMQRVRDAKVKAMQSPLWSFWEATASPKYDDWKASRETFRTKPLVAWGEYVVWLSRVRHLRAGVKAKGVKLDTPELIDLSKSNEAAPAGDAPTAGNSDREKILKWGAIGAAGLLGVIALVALSSSTKEAREPYDRYRYGYRLAR